MSAINIDRKLHTAMTTCFEGKSEDFNTIASLTAIKCDGYNRLMIQYILSGATWDRVGNIVCYGSFTATGTYTALDGTIENASFQVLATDDGNVGYGEIYVVENVPPWVKVGWDATTAGTAGTISVYAIPFNN
jgi:hypothetical protein